MSHRTAISDDGARLEIAMYGFGEGQVQEGIFEYQS